MLYVQYGFDARGYSEWSRLVAMLYAHLSRASSLKDVCDGLRMHSAARACVKCATPPSKKNLSNCNKTCNANCMTKNLGWVIGGSPVRMYFGANTATRVYTEAGDESTWNTVIVRLLNSTSSNRMIDNIKLIAFPSQ